MSIDVFISILDTDCSLYTISSAACMQLSLLHAGIDRLRCRLHIRSAVVFNFIRLFIVLVLPKNHCLLIM